MSSALGSNVRLTVDRTQREALREVFAEVLGSEVIQPPGFDNLEIYRLAGGGSIGAYFVESEDALTPAQLRQGTWLEFLVDDVEAVRAALAARGIEPFEYFDRSHHYFAAPGGQVFRLAARGAAV